MRIRRFVNAFGRVCAEVREDGELWFHEDVVICCDDLSDFAVWALSVATEWAEELEGLDERE